MMYCLPTGGFDPRKHAGYEACARAELSEEARLAGGAWLPLLPEGHPGIAEIKWGRRAGVRGAGGGRMGPFARADGCLECDPKHVHPPLPLPRATLAGTGSTPGWCWTRSTTRRRCRATRRS